MSTPIVRFATEEEISAALQAIVDDNLVSRRDKVKTLFAAIGYLIERPRSFSQRALIVQIEEHIIAIRACIDNEECK